MNQLIGTTGISRSRLNALMVIFVVLVGILLIRRASTPGYYEVRALEDLTLACIREQLMHSHEEGIAFLPQGVPDWSPGDKWTLHFAAPDQLVPRAAVLRGAVWFEDLNADPIVAEINDKYFEFDREAWSFVRIDSAPSGTPQRKLFVTRSKMEAP